jgi:hypothetical protein
VPIKSVFKKVYCFLLWLSIGASVWLFFIYCWQFARNTPFVGRVNIRIYSIDFLSASLSYRLFVLQQ